jgi:2-keto-3-deoxy-L-rhamnonate aldolase RhmA
MFNLMLITNDPLMAEHAVKAGVDRIFIDLERIGKVERQGHLDTLISFHQMSDIKKVRAVIPGAELLVRLNPTHSGSAKEIDDAIDAGADIIMLPMFHLVKEVSDFSRWIAGRVRFMPLIETKQAAELCTEIIAVEGVTDLYIGLNDLHLDMEMKFIFEPVSIGLIDTMAGIIKTSGIPFGFGGIARLGEGMLPAEKVLSQHVRLGSTNVILSRTFHRRSNSLSELNNLMNLEVEISKLRVEYSRLRARSKNELDADFVSFKTIVNRIVEGL